MRSKRTAPFFFLAVTNEMRFGSTRSKSIRYILCPAAFPLANPPIVSRACRATISRALVVHFALVAFSSPPPAKSQGKQSTPKAELATLCSVRVRPLEPSGGEAKVKRETGQVSRVPGLAEPARLPCTLR